MNNTRFAQTGDPGIVSRIAACGLAFRMQSAAPELIDLSGETPITLERDGVAREDPPIKADRAGGPGQFRKFAANCLLAGGGIKGGLTYGETDEIGWNVVREFLA